jgi:hypothetical protein
MALRLRRGTNAERTGEVFAVGELVYTTDTKQLYVGDGVTTGGLLVSSSSATSPAALTRNLDLAGFDISGTGNITATSFTGDGSGLTNLPGGGTGVVPGQEYEINIQGDVRGDDTTVIVDATLGRVTADLYGDGSNITNQTLQQLSNVNITGPVTSQVLKYDGANWVNGTDAGTAITVKDEGVALATAVTTFDFVGDGVTVSGTGTEKTVTIPGAVGGGGGEGVIAGQTYDINITGDVLADDSSIMVNTATQEITGAGGITGDVTGDVTSAGSSSFANVTISNNLTVDNTLTVNGNLTTTGIVASQFEGSLYSVNSGLIIDAEDGSIYTDVIRNSSGTIFIRAEQDSQNLIQIEASNSTGNTSTPQTTVKYSHALDRSSDDDLIYRELYQLADSVGTKTTYQHLAYKSQVSWGASATDATPSDKIMSLKEGYLAIGGFGAEARLDVRGDVILRGQTTAFRNGVTTTNGHLLYNSDLNKFEAYENGAWVNVIQDLGNFTFTGNVIDTDDSSAITVTPAVVLSSDLSVENHLAVTGTVTADKFISTGTETPEISASANLNLTAGNAVVVTSSPLRMASFTTTERNALAAQNGDIIYNTTDNKFQGYENGAWANLI